MVKKPTLIDNAGTVWHRLWSVRLSLLASSLGAVECGAQIYLSGQPPLIAAGFTLLSLGSAVARLVAQPRLHGDHHE